MLRQRRGVPVDGCWIGRGFVIQSGFGIRGLRQVH